MIRKLRLLAEVGQKSYPNVMKPLFSTIAILSIVAIFFPGIPEKDILAAACVPTEEDALGPFYKPNAPIRSLVGKGYVLQGIVRSSTDCTAVSGAVIELWLAGPDGGYDDAHRATIIVDASAAYRFESNLPPPYFGRPPHIHLRVSAKGFVTLVTQHYPQSGRKEAVFDVVLVPSR
jgi:protocatechuate 3,4-dioxygenase beta subunit